MAVGNIRGDFALTSCPLNRTPDIGGWVGARRSLPVEAGRLFNRPKVLEYIKAVISSRRSRGFALQVRLIPQRIYNLRASVIIYAWKLLEM